MKTVAYFIPSRERWCRKQKQTFMTRPSAITFIQGVWRVHRNDGVTKRIKPKTAVKIVRKGYEKVAVISLGINVPTS